MKLSNFTSVFIALIAICAFFAIPSMASAAPMYVKIEAGSTANTEVEGIALSDDLAYGAALGADFGPVRVEAGVSHFGADILSIATASALNYRATAFVDFGVTDRSAFYAGAGLDYITAEANLLTYSVDGEGDGWHYVVGYSWALNDAITLDANVRHVEADLDFGVVSDVSLETDLVSAGIRLAL